MSLNENTSSSRSYAGLRKAVVVAWLSVLASACETASPLEDATCTPGQVSYCMCESESPQQRICNVEGRYPECGCVVAKSDARVGGEGGAGGSKPPASVGNDAAMVPVTDGGSPKTDSSVVPVDARGIEVSAPDAAPKTDAPPLQVGCMAGKLAAGSGKLLGVFPTNEGIIIASTNAINLMDRTGSVLKSYVPPRPLSTVSFDGTYLAAADAAKLNVLTPSLNFQGDVLLTEPCADSVIVGKNLFVCGPANDWDRVFYTYQLATRSFLAASAKFTYNGIPMRRIPGTDDFITVSISLSPSDFHLYHVNLATGDVKFVNESPYHGDFTVTDTYGLVGTPSTHVINPEGLMLKIYGPNCDALTNSFNSQCFIKDGNLGTLNTGQHIAAFGADGSGVIYALVSTTGGYFEEPCKSGCTLQTIDVTGRKVMTSRMQTLAAKSFVALEPDTSCGTAIVGYSTGMGSSFDPSTGFQVDVLRL